MRLNLLLLISLLLGPLDDPAASRNPSLSAGLEPDSIIVDAPFVRTWRALDTLIDTWGITRRSSDIRYDNPQLGHSVGRLKAEFELYVNMDNPVHERLKSERNTFYNCGRGRPAFGSDDNEIALTVRTADNSRPSTIVLIEVEWMPRDGNCRSTRVFEQRLLSHVKASAEGGDGPQTALQTSIAAEQAVLRRRVGFARTTQSSFNDANLDITVTIAGEANDILFIRYILASEVFANRLAKMTTLFEDAERLGFTDVWLTSGYGRDWSFPLKGSKLE